MTIIDRWLMREIIKTLLVVLVVIALILLSNTLVRYLGKAAGGSLNTDVLLIVVGLELVRALGLILPPAFFFAVLWVVGRMYRDSEMTALAASGFGDGRLFRAVLLVAVPLAMLAWIMVMELLPWARGEANRLRAETANSMDLAGVRAGRFNEFSRGELVVYSERLSDDGFQLHGVFVQDRQHGRVGLVSAELAYQTTLPETGERFVILANGHRYEGAPGEPGYVVGSFDEYAVRIPTLLTEVASVPRSAKSWRQLRESDSLRDHAELQYRWSIPLALVAFGVLAVPLARSPPRAGVYGRLTVAVFLYFAFMNLQQVAERWLSTGALPRWMGIWWIPLLMLLVAGLIMLVDSNRFAVLRRRWLRATS